MTKPGTTNNFSAVIRKLESLSRLRRQAQRILITLADPEPKITELPEQSIRITDEAWACIMLSWKPKAAGIADLARQFG